MSFTKQQKELVIKELQSMGWKLDNGVIESPSQGLYFNDSHFEWDPKQMHEIIRNKGQRVAREKFVGWDFFSEEKGGQI